MHDDDDPTKTRNLRGTIPFEDIDLLLDEVMDATDLLDEVAEGDEVEERTDPFRPAMLVDSTRQHPVPVDLLWQAMRPDDGWMSAHAIVGRNGILRLSADAVDKLVPGERVEIRVRRLKRQVQIDADD